MVYLRTFDFPSGDAEQEFLKNLTHASYDSFYPFQLFSYYKKLPRIEFDDVTIFCGSNGSGKSTLLNVIAESIKLHRNTPYNKTDFFEPYINLCHYQLNELSPERMRDLMSVSRIITSDDVFKQIIEVRERNDNLSFKRELIFEEKADMELNGWQGPKGFNADDPESIEAYREYYFKFSKPSSKYIRKKGYVDERTYSNGENGFKYFTDAIRPGGLYLLDEPENSLSSEMQLELVQFILGMARFYDCQFIMSTHSPFILSLPFAKIYNMDELPVKTCKWTELPNVRIYYDFFKEHEDEFEK